MKTGKEAIAIMIKAYGDKRKEFRDEIKRVDAELAGMRVNAKSRKGREEYRDSLIYHMSNVVEKIHELDSFDAVIEEYEAMQSVIADLCDRRRELFFNGVLESSLVTTMRDGVCYV